MCTDLRIVTTPICSLRTRIEKKESPPATPEVEDTNEENNEIKQAVTLFQSIIKGRASQILVRIFLCLNMFFLCLDFHLNLKKI